MNSPTVSPLPPEAKLRVKNWRVFQHYKDRSPPWIKLQKSLLDDYDFQCLPLASRALAPMLWLLASESNEGDIDADSKKLAFRLRWPEKEVAAGLTPLIKKGFLVRASASLAEPEQLATSETEGETETEGEAEGARPTRKCPPTFVVTDQMRAWAAEKHPTADIDAETEAFRDYTFARSMTDWPATWRNWIRKSKPKGGYRSLTKYEQSMKALEEWGTHDTGSDQAPLAITGPNVRTAVG
jgi:hypothetical protein